LNNGYNFTNRVRTVLAKAREEAVRLRHEYVGTEHILLGIIREGEGVSVTVLENLRVDFDAVEQMIEAQVKRGKTTYPTGPDLPYTSRAKKVLELAMAEARGLDHSYVGTEHLLLGLLREEKGLAGEVLLQSGVTYELARAETARILGTDRDAPMHISSLATRRVARAARTDRELDDAARGSDMSISPRVMALLNMAHEEAADRAQPGIDVDHIVLAMLRSREGAAIAILENLGANIGALCGALASAAARGTDSLSTERRLDYTPALQRLIQHATEECELDATPELGTQHILIATFRTGSSRASELLTAAGVTLERARAESRRISG
jgi:ATP-dependent Clp protease ATP-binding subunit ClpA